jgi:hypothetical protein
MREIMTKKLTLGIMGPGRSGKDEAAEWLAANTTLTYAGTTSVAISREVARREGIGFAEAHAQRHARRGYWRALGDEMRAHNASALAEEMLKDSTLLVGVRARIEMQAVIEKRLCDLVIWVDRPGIPHDPTLEFGPELCDFTIHNWWDVPEYLRRWRNLATTLGVMNTDGMGGKRVSDGREPLVTVHTGPAGSPRPFRRSGDDIVDADRPPSVQRVYRPGEHGDEWEGVEPNPDGSTALGRAIREARGGDPPVPRQGFA